MSRERCSLVVAPSTCRCYQASVSSYFLPALPAEFSTTLSRTWLRGFGLGGAMVYGHVSGLMGFGIQLQHSGWPLMCGSDTPQTASLSEAC